MGRRAHGEGSIYKDEQRGCWYASVRKDGRRKKVRVKTRKEAVEALRQLNQEATAHGLGAAAPQTMANFLAWWLDTKRPTIKPSTLRDYDLRIRRMLPHIGSLRLHQVTAAHVEHLYNVFRSPTYVDVSGQTGPLSEQTICHQHALLRMVFRKAVRLEYLRRTPLDGVESPRVRHRPEMKTLSAEQLRHLFAATHGTRLHALWVILGTTGIRLGEALGLKWSDYSAEEAYVVVRRSVQRVVGQGMQYMAPKTQASRRVVPLATGLRHVLEDQKAHIEALRTAAQELWQEHDLLFPSDVGTPLDPSNVNKLFHKALCAAELPSVRVHDLRHTFATLAFAQRVSAREVQEILGHSTVTTTLATYTHVVPQMKRHAVDQVGNLCLTEELRGSEGR